MNPKWMQKLSIALGLQPVGQDWGIENADSRRVSEFIAFFSSNVADDPWEPEALAELIFQSMNEAMEGSLYTPVLHEEFCAFLRSNSKRFPITLQYWLSLKGNVEFPVSNLIEHGSE